MTNKGRTKQEDIEETIRKGVSEIGSIDDKINLLDIKEKESIDEIRKCSYHNIGFCRSKAECSFYHPNNSCAQFERKEFAQKDTVETVTKDYANTGKEVSAIEVIFANSAIDLSKMKS